MLNKMIHLFCLREKIENHIFSIWLSVPISMHHISICADTDTDTAEAQYLFWECSYWRMILVLIPVSMYDTDIANSSIGFCTGIGGISISTSASYWCWSLRYRMMHNTGIWTNTGAQYWY